MYVIIKLSLAKLLIVKRHLLSEFSYLGNNAPLANSNTSVSIVMCQDRSFCEANFQVIKSVLTFNNLSHYAR